MRQTEEKPFTRQSLILPIYLPAFLLSVAHGLLIPTLPLYAKSFDLSLGLIGLVVAAQQIGVLAADVPAGILLERIGRKSSMLIGAAVLGLCTVGVGLAHTFIELICYQLIGGVGAALWGISRHTYMADVIPIPERGRSLALFGGINRIGAFLGPAIGGYFGETYGLRVPFFLCGGILAANFLLCLFFIAETKGRVVMGHQLYFKQFWSVLKANYRVLVAAGAGQIGAQTLRAGRHLIIPLYGSEAIGLNVQAVGFIVSISSFVDMSLFPAAGFIMDRFGRRYATVPCFFIFATGMAMVPFTHSYMALLVATIIMGLGNGIGSGTMMTLGADLAPADRRGEFLGVWRLIGDVGGTTGPLIVGNIAELTGLAVSAASLAGIGYIAVALFLGLVPETLQRTKK
jgi:MFS family permease